MFLSFKDTCGYAKVKTNPAVPPNDLPLSFIVMCCHNVIDIFYYIFCDIYCNGITIDCPTIHGRRCKSFQYLCDEDSGGCLTMVIDYKNECCHENVIFLVADPRGISRPNVSTTFLFSLSRATENVGNFVHLLGLNSQNS